MHTHVAIIGAGPAGLTAAYLLGKHKIPVAVIEADPEYVGGISRTAKYKGYHFDIGGHRFFSKSRAVEDLWTELLPDDMLQRPRSSRIFYGGQFYSYPLRGLEALRKLGPVEAARCVLSYARARAFPYAAPRNLEEWVTNKFGERLFSIFFKTYTEKVWGMDCKDISPDWAAQRINNLSLGAAVINALRPQRAKPAGGDVVKSLIDTFRYPRKGPGMLWEEAARKVRAQGGSVLMGQRVTACRYDDERKRWTLEYEGAGGAKSALTADHVISSAPLRELALGLSPHLSDEAREAAQKLKYRDFITVMLVVPDRGKISDNWIYIHDPAVKVGRVQNFKSWSPEMVPDPTMASYGLEYFCFEGDGLWTSRDEDLIALATRELVQIGIIERASEVKDGCVVRQPKAYPVYDDQYTAHVARVREELEARFPTLHVVGRNGMHKYNNQDHAMMTAMLTVENIVAGRRAFDVWQVNQDAEYHEAGAAGAEGGAGSPSSSGASGLRSVPTRAS